MRIGYAGTNKTLNLAAGKKFHTRPEHERAVVTRLNANIDNLSSILGWNFVNGIRMYRMNVDMVPYPMHFDYRRLLRHAGNQTAGIKLFLEDTGMRLTLHTPELYLTSPKPAAISRAIRYLTYCSELLNALGGDDSVMVTHLGRRSDAEALHRVRRHIGQMPQQVLRYLAIENDQQWTPDEVDSIASYHRIAMVYDIFHHKLHDVGFPFTDENIQTSLLMASNRSRAAGKTPKVHVSSQKMRANEGAHADYIEYADYAKLRRNMDAVKVDCDIMVEANANDLAIIALRAKVETTPSNWRVRTENHYL